jgi:hypothetical protein
LDKKHKSRRARRLAGFFLSTSGSACLVLSVLLAVHTKYFLVHAVRTKGTVVQMLPVKRISDGGVTPGCLPEVRFQTEDGQSHTIRLNDSATNPPEFQVGDTLTLLYDRGSPKGATPDSFAQLWIVPVILLGIGVAHGLVGIVLLYFDQRYRKSCAASVGAIQPL